MLYTILISTIAGLGIIATLYLGFAWVLARVWCKPKRLPVTKSPADFGMEFERVEYFSHGIAINGWFIPAESNAFQLPAIVLAHGWCKNAVEMLPLARLLSQAGFPLLLYDARSHGASGEDGPITILKLAQDIIAAVDYLEGRPDVDKDKLGVLGRSIGGSAAILAASTDQRIRALVSCSAFADPKTLTKDFLAMKHIPADIFAPLVFRFIEGWLGTRMNSVAPQNRLVEITSPILLVHGEKDWYIKPSNMEILHARASQHAECVLIPGRGHSDVMRDPLCMQEIVSFFDKNLHPAENQVRSITLQGVES
jgi:pimeloyl-ACP methyl ester carboxylesterase